MRRDGRDQGGWKDAPGVTQVESYPSRTSHCPSGNQSTEAGDVGAREKRSHPSLNHRSLSGPHLQDPRKRNPPAWSTPLPHPCSCHSCRSTGLQGAGSGSQTPPPRSSGGPHQCHRAGCGRGTVSASAEETPAPIHPQPPAEQPRPGPTFLHPPHPNPQSDRQRGEREEGSESWGGRWGGERRPGDQRLTGRRRHCPQEKERKGKTN